MSLSAHEHDVHVRGGKASHAALTGWRAQYGEIARDRRAQAVAEARARLASSLPPLATGGDRIDDGERSVRSSAAVIAPSEESSTTIAATRTGRVLEPAVGGSSLRADTALASERPARSSAPSASKERKVERAARTAPRSWPRRPELIAREEFLIATEGKLTPRQQAEQLGIKYGTLTATRGRLAARGKIALRHYTFEHRPWTADEQRYLYENVGRISIADIAKKLNRSAHGVILRCKHTGISRRERRRANSDTMTATQVAKILGIDIHDVTRHWIQWGILKAARHPWLRAGGRKEQWAIRREDLVDLLIDHPWQYDRARIKEPFFRRVADEAWNRDPLYTTAEAAKMLGFHRGSHGKPGQHAMSSFMRNTAPKFVPRARLVVRRRGRPGSSGRSLAGMDVFVPRSTIDAIKASGWRHVDEIYRRSDAWSAGRAAAELRRLPDRPRWVTAGGLADRIRELIARGAIPSWEERLGPRRFRLVRPADVLALKDALFTRGSRIWPNFKQRRLIARHDPSWLDRPTELAAAMADGRMRTLLESWMRAEFRLAHPAVTKWAYVTKHVRRVLESIGPRTRMGGSRRVRTYHLRPCAPGLVEIPLAIARRRGLEICDQEAFERAHPRARRRGRIIELPVCSSCGTSYRRGPGRPPKLPICASCRPLVSHGKRRARPGRRKAA